MCLLFEFSRVEFCGYFTIVSPKSFNYTACRRAGRAGGRFKEQRVSHSVKTKSDKSEIQVSFEFFTAKNGESQRIQRS